MSNQRPCALLTRPLMDSRAFAERVQTLGWDVLISPVMEIVQRDVSYQKIEGLEADGWVITSRYAVPGFMKLRAPSDTRPVFAIGRSTRRALAREGIPALAPESGESEGLADLISDYFPAARARLIHLCGTHVSSGFQRVMEELNVTLHAVTVYEAQEVKELSHEAVNALREQKLAAIFFFSARSAALFHSLCRRQCLETYLRATRALCLAPSVIKSLDPENWLEILTAPHPDPEAMLTMLEKINT